MIRGITRLLATSIALACVSAAAPANAQSAPAGTIALHVDASHAVQGILFVHETIPVSAGPLTLQYPKWIPGEHAPNGPVGNVAGVRLSAAGKTLAWTRDRVDLYALHADIPTGASTLDVSFEYLGANGGLNSVARFSTPTIMTLTWNKVLLVPKVADYRTQTIAASLTLPSADWSFATALETRTHRGAEVAFAPVSQEQLVDSPLDAGTVSRTWQIGEWDGAPVSIAAFADTPEQLVASDATLAKFRSLVTQMHALYRARHWNHYTFLLTLSEIMPGQGVEHHQSSDNGTKGRFLTDAESLVANADLLPHEFNHSWDGKYRRPADLATSNLDDPMQDDLLWVYEGMTQFYGDLQAERSGLLTEQQYLDRLAGTYASLDSQRGRDWRPLVDTATSSSLVYGSRGAWAAERRGADYYSEGELLWLEADLKIAQLTGGTKSLDDFARAFFGGADGGPVVVPYVRADVVSALNAVAPYDWDGFLRARVDEIAPHPPDPIVPGGYRLVYGETPSAYAKTLAGSRGGGADARYSLGLMLAKDGTVVDVLPGSPAYLAGAGPGLRIAALDERSFSGDQRQLDDALRAHRNGTPLRLLVVGGDVYRTLNVTYRGGPRFPHLERVTGRPDALGAIVKPLSL